MSEIRYALRPPKESDLGFLMNAWIACLKDYRSPFEVQSGYHDAQRFVVAHLLERSKVIVACGVGDTVNGQVRGEDYVYGYAVGEPRGRLAVLHWAYVRNGYRTKGIGRAMTKRLREGCGVNVTITACTKPWIREMAERFGWRVAEMAPLYQLIRDYAKQEEERNNAA